LRLRSSCAVAALALAGCAGAATASSTRAPVRAREPAVVVMPLLRLPAQVPIAAARWAVSYDRGGRHVELVGSGPLVIGGGGTATHVIASARTDPLGLLLQRLAELHARVRVDQWPSYASRKDVLNLNFGWTNGFYEGALWQAAALAPEGGMFARWALASTIAHLGHETAPTHDVGFMYGESSLAAWEADCQGRPLISASTCGRLRASVLAAAGELVTLARSNPVAGTIPTDPTSPVAETIVDSMMNILILPWATQQTGEPVYAQLARHQANVIAKLLVRSDGSTYQAVHFDRTTGKVVFIGTHQGLSDSSTWARGEGWALYGFAELADELHGANYLRVALHLARFVAAHLPASGVPLWDYDAPATAPVDVSAGVITAAGLLHLADSCALLRGVCRDGARWSALAQRMLAGAFTHLSVRPPLGYLGDQVTDERTRGCPCNGVELIYGLTYALEALHLDTGGASLAQPL
jgi:hypothetical protein